VSDPEDAPAPGSDPAPSDSQTETLFDGPPSTRLCPDGEPPERISHYRLEGPLGHGGMGEVFLAWDEILERRVAIKRIRQGSAQSSDQRERFHREARAAGSLSHSAIVQIHELILDRDAIVMEYVHGSTLAERLETGPLPVRESLRLAREIAEGLAAAHAAGLIHRDLKAENVIITPQGQAKILDFGLVKPVAADLQDEALTRKGVLLGTYHSMSPEQAGGGHVDERSDLFSLGVLLYEMLSGIAPFRGDNPLDTLKRVIADRQSPLAQVRSDIPPEVSALVDRLLAKSRDERPHSAQETVRALRELEALMAPDVSDSVSEMVTADWTSTARKRDLLSDSRRRRYAWAGWAALLVALTAAYLVHRSAEAPAAPAAHPKLLRVLVLRPEVVSATKDQPLELAATGAQASAFRVLTTLEGLAPLDPEEIVRSQGSPQEIARAAAASELIRTTVAREGEMGRVTMLRTQVQDGQVLKEVDFRVPMGQADLQTLASAVKIHLRQLYPERSLRPGAPDLQVSNEDYAAFLEVKRDRDTGGIDLAQELGRLDKIAGTSPRFLDALLLAADTSLSLHQSTRDPQYLERAQRYIRQAGELAADEPQILIRVFKTELAGALPDKARETLAKLDRLLPGDTEVLSLHARLEDQEGQTKKAVETMRRVVEQARSWQNLGYLAYLEAREGQVEEARAHIGEILPQDPDNQKVLDLLAKIELLYGELAKAEEIYEKLSRSRDDRASFTDLGLTRFFEGHYEEAAAAYRRALEIEPGHIDATLNLADVEAESGRQAEAETLYRQVLRHFGGNPAAAGVQPKDGMTEAQCLARLGEKFRAVEVAREVQKKNPNDGGILSEAALVYCLAGDRDSEIRSARAALQSGVQGRWLSAYRCLREDPDIKSLLETAQRR
jgi:Flp pilus assembly protein TadD/tRNA A-37 threonylcarbamoyl transferase component Bud32